MLQVAKCILLPFIMLVLCLIFFFFIDIFLCLALSYHHLGLVVFHLTIAFRGRGWLVWDPLSILGFCCHDFNHSWIQNNPALLDVAVQRLCFAKSSPNQLSAWPCSDRTRKTEWRKGSAVKAAREKWFWILARYATFMQHATHRGTDCKHHVMSLSKQRKWDTKLGLPKSCCLCLLHNENYDSPSWSHMAINALQKESLLVPLLCGMALTFKGKCHID